MLDSGCGTTRDLTLCRVLPWNDGDFPALCHHLYGLLGRDVMKILVAVDGTECSHEAVEFLTHRRWHDDDEFLVLNVVEARPIECGQGFVAKGEQAEDVFIAGVLKQSGEIVARSGQELKIGLSANRIEVKVLTGYVVEQICQWAKEWDADLIVLGSHGRKGFQHFMLGSVAEEVMKKAPCSVQVVKEKKYVPREHQSATSK